MIVTRELVARLERVEATVVAADLARRGDASVDHRHDGVLAVVPSARPDAPSYARAHGITLAELDADDVAAVGGWFAAHDATALVQVSAWAPEGTVASLAATGAVPAWARSVHARPVGVPVEPAAPDDVEVSVVGAEDLDPFLDTLVAAMRGPDEIPTETDRERARTELADPVLGQWLARIDGEPAGAAIATVVDGVVTLGPAGTLARHRRRGVQRALIEARLAAAAAWDADVATVTTHVDTPSARNAARCGFSLVQQQWVVRLPGGRP